MSTICPVVGLTFCDDYPANVLALAELPEQAEGLAVVLVRDPENPHDANAVEVHVTAVGRVGSVPRWVAQGLAPKLDAGILLRAHVHQFQPATSDLHVPRNLTVG